LEGKSVKAHNFEQKFRCEDLDAVVRLCRESRYRFHARLVQKDIFFNVKTGRLKVRLIDGGSTELIHYFRPNRKGPRKCAYVRVPVGGEPNDIIGILKSVAGIVGIVKKKRTVYYHENVRIHIDRVEKLGDFVELEAEIRGRYKKGLALALLKSTKAALKLDDRNAIELSYIDLLEANKQ
jgi:predicted adenylyl cyclase CyaB